MGDNVVLLIQSLKLDYSFRLLIDYVQQFHLKLQLSWMDVLLRWKSSVKLIPKIITYVNHFLCDKNRD
jgi:hypothetical protein